MQIEQALLQLETEGFVLRGQFTHLPVPMEEAGQGNAVESS